MPNKVIIITGAGASHDFSREKQGEHYLPPLAKDLFNAAYDGIINRYPPLKVAAVRNIRDALDRKRPIEEYLEEMWAKSGTELIGRQVHAAVFYLQDLLWTCSRQSENWTGGNYGALISNLLGAEVEVGIITFNYDTLVENALQQLMPGSFDFQSIENYIRNPVPVIKLHGSVNWAKRIRINDLNTGADGFLDWVYKNSQLMNEVLENTTDDDVFVRQGGLEQFRADPEAGNYYYPALSAPTQSKVSFNCPAQHVEQAKKILVEANILLIIGWRATEDHFGKILHETVGDKPIKVVIVAKESGEETVTNLRRYMPAMSETVVTGGFSGFIKDDRFKDVV